MKDVTRGTAWQSINTGLAKYAGFFHEEISDILVSTNNGTLSIYAANNFRPSIYKMDMKDKSWAPVLELPGDFGFIESLSVDSSDKLTFVNTTGALGYNIDTKVYSTIDLSLLKKTAEDKAGAKLECVYVVTNSKPAYQFNNLWLLNNAPDRKYTTIAGNKKGIYVQPNLVKRPAKFNAMLSVMSNNNLNLMVIDMKDDWGNLRFKPDSDILKKMGRTAGSIDLPPFIKSMKDRSIYLVARLVLFQDHVIYDYNNHEFAVKSASTKQAWQGTKKQKDGTIKQIQEFWVDPYSEKVWEYNVAIAKELIQKGFDEIQFDYVRFPTDGLNLEDASFSWRDPGMDKESAIMSFLAYARENIDAPISIDIYGANGWYRTGARTGQDVELFRKYVDVICPMFYPSHFEQNFMAYDPAEKRPFRIYYFGDLRNYYIARKSLVIRPYVQAFNLHVSYDRKYFGPDYVAEEIKGVDESTSMGYTFWNMGGQYSILNDAYQKIAEKKSPQVKK